KSTIKKAPKKANGLLVVCAAAGVLPILLYLCLHRLVQGSGLIQGVVLGIILMISKCFEVATVPLRLARLNASIDDSQLRALCFSISSSAGAMATLTIIV